MLFYLKKKNMATFQRHEKDKIRLHKTWKGRYVYTSDSWTICQYNNTRCEYKDRQGFYKFSTGLPRHHVYLLFPSLACTCTRTSFRLRITVIIHNDLPFLRCDLTRTSNSFWTGLPLHWMTVNCVVTTLLWNNSSFLWSCLCWCLGRLLYTRIFITGTTVQLSQNIRIRNIFISSESSYTI